MRVLVTGAGGFTGRYVVQRLSARGHEPKALTADLTDLSALEAEIATLRPDATIHLAANAFVSSEDHAEFYDVNLVGTVNLLEQVRRHAAGSKVLLASSAQVYGTQAGGRLSEATPLNPQNHYAVSKAAMEMAAQLYAGELRLIVARPFNYTGVGQEERYLIPKIVAHFRRRERVIELGNLDVERDFGDVRAVADAYCSLVELGDVDGPVNVASGQETSVRRIVDMLIEQTGHAIEVRVNPAFVRVDDVPVLVGATDRVRSLVPGWMPISIEDTLGWMLGSGLIAR